MKGVWKLNDCVTELWTCMVINNFCVTLCLCIVTCISLLLCKCIAFDKHIWNKRILLLSEFWCDLIKCSDNTWNPVWKLQEFMWAALGKPLMSNYLYGRQWKTTVRWVVWLVGRWRFGFIAMTCLRAVH